MPRNRPDRDGGGSGRRLLATALIVLGVGGGLYLARDPISAQLHDWLAGGSAGDLAQVPQPRINTPVAPPNPEAAQLADMPALVTTDGGTSTPWPELGPADLLAQSGALGDRALKETAFDQPPWRRFARPFTAPEGRPLIGLLVTGLGTDRAATAAAIAGLPAEVSLSFDPYAAELRDWIAAARAFGHEAMVDLPLQSKDKRDPGALGLLVGLNADEIGRRIDAIEESAPGAFGFVGTGGDALLLDDTTTAVVMQEIARLGLSFVDTSGEPMSLAAASAGQDGLPMARSDVVLDERSSRNAIAERLAAAVGIAQDHGRVLAVARGSQVVVAAIADWLRRLGDRSPVPAPASALMRN